MQNTRNNIIRTGDMFPIRNNFQLINHLTSRNIKNWYKATYKLTPDYYMWITALDGKARRGWQEVILSDGRIKQNYLGDRANLPSNFELAFEYAYRAVFKKDGDSFTFMGVYKLSNEMSTKFERVFEKIADETTLFDF